MEKTIIKTNPAPILRRDIKIVADTNQTSVGVEVVVVNPVEVEHPPLAVPVEVRHVLVVVVVQENLCQALSVAIAKCQSI